MSDPVNHPAHYTEHPSGVECIQITEHMGFNLGNAVKYIWRADLKGSAIQDLEKARWYIDRELVKRGVATAPPAVRDGSDLVVVQRSHTAKAVQSWMTLDLWTDLGKNDKDFDAEYERQGFGDLWATLLGEVRALVQAAEPAEDAPCAICNVNETNHPGVSYYHPFTTELGPFDDEGNDRPVPAEPAEEETKAGPWTVQLPEGMTMEQWIESLPDEAPGLLAAVREVRERLGVSSPVVPAPTETGPWA